MFVFSFFLKALDLFYDALTPGWLDRGHAFGATKGGKPVDTNDLVAPGQKRGGDKAGVVAGGGRCEIFLKKARSNNKMDRCDPWPLATLAPPSNTRAHNPGGKGPRSGESSGRRLQSNPTKKSPRRVRIGGGEKRGGPGTFSGQGEGVYGVFDHLPPTSSP